MILQQKSIDYSTPTQQFSSQSDWIPNFNTVRLYEIFSKTHADMISNEVHI